MKIAICLKNSRLMKLCHFTCHRFPKYGTTFNKSTTTFSMRSRCSNLGPKTIRLSAEMVLMAPVSEWMVSRYLGTWARIAAPEGVGGAGDVAQLPVDVPLNARDVEEHVHPRQKGCRGEGRQSLLILNVDGCPALNRHVKHLDVVVNHHDVGYCTTICILRKSMHWFHFAPEDQSSPLWRG